MYNDTNNAFMSIDDGTSSYINDDPNGTSSTPSNRRMISKYQMYMNVVDHFGKGDTYISGPNNDLVLRYGVPDQKFKHRTMRFKYYSQNLFTSQLDHNYLTTNGYKYKTLAQPQTAFHNSSLIGKYTTTDDSKQTFISDTLQFNASAVARTYVHDNGDNNVTINTEVHDAFLTDWLMQSRTIETMVRMKKLSFEDSYIGMRDFRGSSPAAITPP